MPWPSRSLGSHSRSPGQSAALRHTTGSGQLRTSRTLSGAQRIPALTSSMAAMIPGVSQPEIQRQVRQQVPTSTRSTSWSSVSIRKSTPWTSSSIADSMRSVASSPRFYVSSAVDSRTSGFHVSLRDSCCGRVRDRDTPQISGQLSDRLGRGWHAHRWPGSAGRRSAARTSRLVSPAVSMTAAAGLPTQRRAWGRRQQHPAWIPKNCDLRSLPRLPTTSGATGTDW
jgi:hypothetical protein